MFHAAGKPCQRQSSFNIVLAIVMIDVSVACRV